MKLVESKGPTISNTLQGKIIMLQKKGKKWNQQIVLGPDWKWMQAQYRDYFIGKGMATLESNAYTYITAHIWKEYMYNT